MLRFYELSIALRYLRSQNKNRFVSFISLISVIGIALAVAVLIIVLSVMSGFEYEVRNRILSVVSHASISGIDGRLDDWRGLNDIAQGNPEVFATAPFVEGQGMAVGTDSIAGVQLRGIEPAAELAASGIGELVVEGSLSSLVPGSYGIVLGRELADRLSAGIGDRIILLTTQGAITPAGFMPRMRRFEVVGIFFAGMYEFDRSLAYINIADSAKLFRLDDAVTGVRLALRDPQQAAGIVRQVARTFGGGVYVTDWSRKHANFFRSIQLTKSIIFVILLLVVAVAAFNIVSTLVMVVRDKRGDIAILRSMGSAARDILWIFMSQGILIGAVGTTLGLVFGVVVSWNLGTLVELLERLLQIRLVAPDIYFISELPTRVRWADVSQICTIAFLLALVSTVYPAWRGALTDPAKALRHD